LIHYLEALYTIYLLQPVCTASFFLRHVDATITYHTTHYTIRYDTIQNFA